MGPLIRRVLVLAVVALGLGLVLSLRQTHRGKAPEGGGKDVAEPAGRPAAEAPRQTQAEVADVVARRNDESQKEAEKFRADGWTVVRGGAPAPDARVTRFDPKLIAEGREEELRLQLASTVPAAEHVANVARIAEISREPATRASALDALGRVRAESAQHALLDLMIGKLAGDEVARRQIAGLVRPSDLDDGVAARLLALLDAADFPAGEKDQLAFVLAVVELRDGVTAATGTPEAAARIAAMKARAQRGILARH